MEAASRSRWYTLLRTTRTLIVIVLGLGVRQRARICWIVFSNSADRVSSR